MNLLAVDTSPLNPGGDAARNIQSVFTPIFWISIVVWVGVSLLIVFAALRFRRRYDDEEPAQVHGHTRLEVAWTITPFLILGGLFGLTAANQPYLRDTAANAQMTVQVQGYQFYWKYVYNDIHARSGKLISVTTTPSGNPFVTEPGTPFVIPTHTKVQLSITSGDPADPKTSNVIHSYYVPTLGGQINAVPGQTNTLWIEADNAGMYYGQCTELCGSGHALMLIEIQAMDQNDFNTWRAKQ